MITNVLHSLAVNVPECVYVCVCVSVNELPKALEKYAFFAHNMPHGHGQHCAVSCACCFCRKKQKKEKKTKEGSLLKQQTLYGIGKKLHWLLMCVNALRAACACMCVNE